MEKTRIEKVCEKHDYDVLLIANLLDEYNDYCLEQGYADEVIYSMDKLDYYFSSYTPTEILDEIFLPKFNPSDYYFKYTINGVISSDYLENLMDPTILEEVFKKWEDSLILPDYDLIDEQAEYVKNDVLSVNEIQNAVEEVKNEEDN